MALLAMRRRVGRLEGVFALDRLAGCPPLTTEEIEVLAERLADGGAWTDEEEARVARQCPIIRGELLITAHRGGVFVKRYPALTWHGFERCG